MLLVQSSFGIGTAILTEASLSFLGLGVPPPALSWGRMLREGYSFILEAPWLSLAAGSAIFLIALASQMVADALQGILARGPDAPWRHRGPARRRGGASKPAVAEEVAETGQRAVRIPVTSGRTSHTSEVRRDHD